MRNLSFIFAFTFLITSCGVFTFDTPEMRGKEKINLSKVDGKTIVFTAKANVYNPNWYGLKVKPSMLDLYIDNEYMGKVHLDKKVKLKRKKENDLEAEFTAELTDGALMKAMKYAMQKEIKVQLKGKIKGGVFIFSKKFDFDETKTIPGTSFRMGN